MRRFFFDPQPKEFSQSGAEAQSHQADGMQSSPGPGHFAKDSTNGPTEKPDPGMMSESPGPYGLLHLGRGSFGDAIRAAKDGKKVARAGWNGAGMYAAIMPGYPDGVPCNEATAKTHNVDVGTILKFRPYWQLKTAQNDIAMWAPSGSDSLADDWVIVD
jgi:hypothetical protein